MKLLGENSTRIEISRKSPSSDLVEFDFSCEWCSGKFEFFSSNQDFAKLEKLCASIASGSKKGGWISEEGDLELKLLVQSSGRVRVNVICCPSVKLAYPGKLEFEAELELASFVGYDSL
ncbi:hypothetical protein [Rhodospirillum sp. A1_3_36]|uniref:hypothetical protein n=1 Tax=Rhodospirillum sp. A1_3_36 TaxID=3391666 RepID=UPI0039A73E2C